MIFIPYYFFFLGVMFLGRVISLSSSRWFYIWIGLEINLLSFIPVIICGSNDIESEGAVKYFLVQALGSCIILLGYFSFLRMRFLGTDFISVIPRYITFFSLIIKIGIFPFHHWLPQVIRRVRWFTCLLLSVLQKLAPSLILCFIVFSFSSSFLLLLGSIGSLFGGLIGINQSQLRVLLAYSSIGHLGWMLSSICLSFFVFFSYYLIYSFIRIGIIFLLSIYPVKLVNLRRFGRIPNFFILLLGLRFLSLAGLPPFLGFYSKLIVLICIVGANKFLFAAILIIGSLINLFYYLGIFFNLYIVSLIRGFSLNFKAFKSYYLIVLSFFIRLSYFGFGLFYIFC